MSRRRTLLLSLLLIAAAGLCAMSSLRLIAARDLADQSGRSLRECKALADQIVAARQHATPASQWTSSELSRRLSSAASAAGIPVGRGGVVDVLPNPPVAIPGTDLREITIPVRLELVSLRQVVVFLHELTADNPSLRVKQIAFRSPGLRDTSDRWLVDVTLANVVAAPLGQGRG